MGEKGSGVRESDLKRWMPMTPVILTAKDPWTEKDSAGLGLTATGHHTLIIPYSQ